MIRFLARPTKSVAAFVATLYMALGLFANPAMGDSDMEAIKALREGDMKKLVLSEPGEPLEGSFERPDGTTVSFADLRGKVLVVNFWATWCAPCRHEMPSLNALDAAMESESFDVIAIASGRNKLPAIDAFFSEAGIDRLEVFLDPSSSIMRSLRAFGLPTTVILDKQGREIGRLTGDADWQNDNAKAVLSAIVETQG